MFTLFITKAYAQAPCTLVPGGCAVANPFPTAIAIAASVVASAIAALCVLMVVWGGVQMGLSNGDDSKITKGRESIMYAMVGMAISLLSQSIVNYVVIAATGIRGEGADALLPAAINWAITSLVYFFNIAIFLVIFYGGLKYVMSRGKEDQADSGRKMIMWAVIGGVCINGARMVAEFVLSLGL